MSSTPTVPLPKESNWPDIPAMSWSSPCSCRPADLADLKNTIEETIAICEELQKQCTSLKEALKIVENVSSLQKDEAWKVNVHIHDCDLEQGYLCGTMEALNVPLADTPKLRGRIGVRNKMEVVQQDDEALVKLENTGIERSKAVDSAVLGKYSIWRRENENDKADSRVCLMRDQMIMARIYSILAKSRDKLDLYQELLARLNESQRSLGKATTDAELPKSASDRIKATGQVLSKARDLLYDCKEITQRLRAMLQSADEQRKKFPNSENLENLDLYHYALFSDNVLSASVVVNSTIMNAKEPEKHVFHLPEKHVIQLDIAFAMWLVFSASHKDKSTCTLLLLYYILMFTCELLLTGMFYIDMNFLDIFDDFESHIVVFNKDNNRKYDGDGNKYVVPYVQYDFEIFLYNVFLGGMLEASLHTGGFRGFFYSFFLVLGVFFSVSLFVFGQMITNECSRFNGDVFSVVDNIIWVDIIPTLYIYYSLITRKNKTCPICI
ncbi:hypothetical protein ACJX0J_041403, partial [Zea mays]